MFSRDSSVYRWRCWWRIAHAQVSRTHRGPPPINQDRCRRTTERTNRIRNFSSEKKTNNSIVAVLWLISTAGDGFGFGFRFGFLYYAGFFHWLGFGLWSPDSNVWNRDGDLSLGWRSIQNGYSNHLGNYPYRDPNQNQNQWKKLCIIQCKW